MEEHDLNRQLNRLIAGSISDEDFLRLQGTLKSDPAARRHGKASRIVTVSNSLT